MPKHVRVTKSETAKAVNDALRNRTQEIRITNGQRRAISGNGKAKPNNGA